MEIQIAPAIQLKLKAKHDVTPEEVEECFCNRTGKFLEDHRPEHKTNPPTLWFVAPTNKKRKLKIVFILDGDILIKTAFEADEAALHIYKKNAFK